MDLSYGELFAKIDAAATRLKELGLQPKMRVGLFCSDCVDYIIASLAILSCQGVLVPVHAASAPAEVESLIEKMKVNVLVFDPELHADENAVSLTPEVWLVNPLTVVDTKVDATFPWLAEVPDPAFIRFSSGTTGSKKGVLLTHTAIHERVNAADKALEITSGDTVLWVLSMSFHFVVSILLFLLRGAKICLCHDDFPFVLKRALDAGKGTFIYASPLHYHMLCASDQFPSDALQNVRLAISTAMRLPQETADRFKEKFDFELAEAYGIIEVGLPFVNRRTAAIPGSVGKVLPDYEVRLHDAAEGVGEICIRGGGIYRGYVSPWSPRQREDWFHTGDLGRFDDEGNLFIVGRCKNLINFAGMKVYPYEVEAVLNSHPAVSESLVYGEPHPRYGHLPCARVVLKAEATPSELQAWCLKRISSYKSPKSVTIVHELPRTPSGKLVRDN
jgi:long-chain acyl-CoA synthetase